MRKISFFLAVIFAVILLVSCSTGSEGETFDLGYSTESDPNSFGGLVVRILYGVDSIYTYGGNGSGIGYVLGYASDNYFADMAYERIDEVQKNADVNLDIEYLDSSTAANRFKQSTFSGECITDVISLGTYYIASDVRTGMYLGISTLRDYIDFTDEAKWGRRSILSGVYYEDDIYGVLPMLWPDVTMGSFGYPIAVNENHIAKLGVTDPREYVENGTWTWAQFEQCLPEYTVIEGGETKIYGFGCHNYYYAEMFNHSNGDKIFNIDKNGNYTCGIFSDTAYKAMQKCYELYTGELSYCFDKTDGGTFIDGGDVLGLCSSGGIFSHGDNSVSMNIDNFGVISFPVGPDVDPNYKFGVVESTNACTAFAPLSVNEDAAAYVINQIYEPFKDFTTYDEIVAYMQRNYFFDERDGRVVYDMFLNQDYNFFHTGNLGHNFRDDMTEYIVLKQPVQTTFESNKDKYMSNFERFCMPTIRAFEKLWDSNFEY